MTLLRQADITTNTVTLVWEEQESKPHYSYMVQASNGSIFLSYIVLNTTTTITGLVAGSYYSFTVTTQTADGTRAAPMTVSYFTRMLVYSAKSIQILMRKTTNVITMQLVQFLYFRRVHWLKSYFFLCTLTEPETVQPSISSNGSNSSLLVSWTAPPGNTGHYRVHLNSTFPQEDQERIIANTTNIYLFENLSAGRLYSARVTTCSGSNNASSGFVYNATCKSDAVF